MIDNELVASELRSLADAAVSLAKDVEGSADLPATLQATALAWTDRAEAGLNKLALRLRAAAEAKAGGKAGKGT